MIVLECEVGTTYFERDTTPWQIATIPVSAAEFLRLPDGHRDAAALN